MKAKPDLRALTKSIEPVQDNEAAVAEYVKLGDKIKELEARKARLKPVLLALVKGKHGEYVQVGKYEVQALDYVNTSFQLGDAIESGKFDMRVLGPFVKKKDCVKILTKKHLG